MNTYPDEVRRSPASLADYKAAGLQTERPGLFDPTARFSSSIHDFTTLRGRPGGKAGATDPVQGVKMLNLVNGGEDAENVTYPGISYSNGAVRFGADDNNLSIRLSQEPRKPNMAMGVWYRSTGIRSASINNRLCAIEGLFNTVLVASVAGGPCTQFEMPIIGGNAVFTNAALLASFSDGALHFLLLGTEKRPGSTHRGVAILDGLRVGEGGEWPIAEPGSAGYSTGYATIGTPEAVGTIVGGFYRTIVEDLDAASMTIDQLAASELRHRPRLLAIG